MTVVSLSMPLAIVDDLVKNMLRAHAVLYALAFVGMIIFGLFSVFSQPVGLVLMNQVPMPEHSFVSDRSTLSKPATSVRRVDGAFKADTGSLGSARRVLSGRTSQSNLQNRSNMAKTEKVQGPASYFPSIEKTYGQPVEHWFGILQAAGNLKHMELVALLKSEHGLGHGHANALVAYHQARH